MDVSLLWKATLVVLAGILLLRIAGRKSISQMTLAQTVLMIGIGSLLVQPVVGKNLWGTFAVGGMLVLTLVILEYLQLKFDFVEKMITGKSKVLIENGNINVQNLRKSRLTVDQLEMQLRQKSVSKLSDVKLATFEPNGQIGYLLKDDAQLVTKKDFKSIQQDIEELKTILQSKLPNTKVISSTQQPTLPNQLGSTNKDEKNKMNEDIFQEVSQNKQIKQPPNFLQ